MSRVEVKPELLRWARDRAGLGQKALQERFPKLSDWESGKARPTLRQLEGYASATHVPIGFMFLPEPPVEPLPIPDFRTMRDEQIEQPSADLLDTLYLCQQRQAWYRDYSLASGSAELAFVASARVGDEVVRAAARIRQELGLDIEQCRHIATWAEALRRFIEHADALGVLVMVSGVVGSNNHRKLRPQEFRGFALVDRIAPLVFINGADTKAAQMFTLAHELAHVWSGQSGVSDAQAGQVPEDRAERWCNEVAAELLVPLAAFRDEYDRRADLRVETDRLARHYKVSTLVVLRRMHDAGGIGRERFWTVYAEEVERLRALPRGGGGDFYLTLGARASKTFARALVADTLEGRTAFTEAFRLLGFRRMATFNEVGRSLGVLV